MLLMPKELRNWLQLDRFNPDSVATFKIAVKTGVAALFTDIGAHLLGLSSPAWAVVSAVIVMQANLGSSLNASGQRLVGTAVGAAIGALLSSLAPQNAVVLGLGMTITILTCAALRVYESFRIATVTLAIVVLTGTGSPWLFGAERFLDVTLGISVALAVTVGLWPSRSRRELHLALAEVLKQDAQLLRFIADSHLQNAGDLLGAAEARAAIKRSLSKSQSLMADIGREPPSAQDPLLGSLLTAVEYIQADLLALERQLPEDAEETLYLGIRAELQNLCDEMISTLIALADALHQEQPSAQRPGLQRTSRAVAERLGELRRDQTTVHYSVESLLRFTNFIHRLQELAQELDRLAGLIATENNGRQSNPFQAAAGGRHSVAGNRLKDPETRQFLE